MLKRLVIGTAAFVALALPALADQNGVACRCLYLGKCFEQGETVCIRVDGRARLAHCDMAQNNTSWTFLSDKDGCPTALMSPLPRHPPPDRSAAGKRPLLALL